MSSNKMSSKQFQKPFCKVCHDAGKSEKEYTSHYVRTEPGPNGKVVCPTLLSQECGYCGACGHTPKFCQVLAKNKAAEEKAAKQATRAAIQEKPASKPAPAPASSKKSSNLFSALNSDSDSETEAKPAKPTKPSEPCTSNNAAKFVPKQPKQPHKPPADEFPTLSKPAAAPIMNKPASLSKTPAFLSAINQMCPTLTVQNKMPEVHIPKPQKLATLVRKQEEDEFINQYIKNKLQGDQAYQQHDRKLTAELAKHSKTTHYECGYTSEEEAYEQQMYCNSSGFDVTEYYEEALKTFQLLHQREPMKASQMNWAETENSDDEDW